MKGVGEDWVGQFVMYGWYELPSGRISFWKKYLDRHAVLYEGFAEDGLGLYGVWRILRLGSHGGFHIQPAG
jgi:hypothetical protein